MIFNSIFGVCASLERTLPAIRQGEGALAWGRCRPASRPQFLTGQTNGAFCCLVSSKDLILRGERSVYGIAMYGCVSGMGLKTLILLLTA